jgi:hypothetical protein
MATIDSAGHFLDVLERVPDVRDDAADIALTTPGPEQVQRCFGE